MLTNGILLAIRRRTGAAVDGTPAYAPATNPRIRIAISDPTSSQRFTLGATIKDASAVLLIPRNVGTLAEGDRVETRNDEGTCNTGEILSVRERVLGSISHWEVFVKPAAG